MEYFESNIKDIRPEEVSIKGTKNATVQWLITNKQGANYFVRKFAVEPYGLISMHFHGYQKTMIITKGSCTLCVGDKVIDLNNIAYCRSYLLNLFICNFFSEGFNKENFKSSFI